MTRTDRAAMQLALNLTLAEKDEGRVEQVKSMLAERGIPRGRKLLRVSPADEFAAAAAIGDAALLRRC